VKHSVKTFSQRLHVKAYLFE